LLKLGLSMSTGEPSSVDIMKMKGSCMCRSLICVPLSCSLLRGSYLCRWSALESCAEREPITQADIPWPPEESGKHTSLGFNVSKPPGTVKNVLTATRKYATSPTGLTRIVLHMWPRRGLFTGNLHCPTRCGGSSVIVYMS